MTEYRLYRAFDGKIIPQGTKSIPTYMTIEEAIEADVTAKKVAYDKRDYFAVLLDFSDSRERRES